MKFFKAVKFDTFIIFTKEVTNSELKEFKKSDEKILYISEKEKCIQYNELHNTYHLFEWTEYYIIGLKENPLDDEDFFYDGSPARNNNGTLFYKNFVGQSKFRNQVFYIKSPKIETENLETLLEDIDNKISSISLAFSSRGVSNSKFTKDLNNDNCYIYIKLFNALKRNRLLKDLIYITKNPTSYLERWIVSKPIELVEEITPDSIRDIFSGGVSLKKARDLKISRRFGGRIPVEINEYKTHISYDTAENRFVKYFIKYSITLLNEFLSKLRKIEEKEKRKNETTKNTILFRDIEKFRDELIHLSHLPFFQNVSNLSVINHANTSLTKGNGYKQIYGTYINLKQTPKNFFDNNSLIELFENKSVDKLYEYICLFRLLEILHEIYQKEKINWQSIKTNSEHFNVSISQSDEIIAFIFEATATIPRSQLLFQHSFNGDESYSVDFRPDFTWQIFCGNKLFNYHFDAKFRVSNGESKNEDLIKMHGYRDGIKNTIGCFVLFPGNTDRFYSIGTQYPYEGIGSFPLAIENIETEEGKLKKLMSQILDDFFIE